MVQITIEPEDSPAELLPHAETVPCTLTIHIRLKSKQKVYWFAWATMCGLFFWSFCWMHWRIRYVSGYFQCWCNLYRLRQNRHAQIHWWLVVPLSMTSFPWSLTIHFSFSAAVNVTGSKLFLKEPDGIVLIYKRLTAPRVPTGGQGDKSEVRNLTWSEFDWLMSGIDIEQPKSNKNHLILRLKSA